MNVIYIDYNEIKKFQENSIKNRILFLKTISDLSSKESTKCNEIGLVGEDLDSFVELLKKLPFRNFFITLEDRIDLVSKIDGKIIVGMDSLLEDLNELQTQLQAKSTVTELMENLCELNENLNQTDLNVFFNKFIPSLFRQWLFKYITIPFIPHSYEGFQTYKKILKRIDKKKLKTIFKADYFMEEIRNIPKREDLGELTSSDIEHIRGFTLDLTKYIENLDKYFFKDHWFKVRNEIDKAFWEIRNQKLTVSEDQIKELYLFLVIKGNKYKNSRNSVISYYHGKTVIFNDSNPLVRVLNGGDRVLGKIIREKSNYIVVNVIKKLDEGEVSHYVENHIKCVPSKNEILGSLH